MALTRNSSDRPSTVPGSHFHRFRHLLSPPGSGWAAVSALGPLRPAHSPVTFADADVCLSVSPRLVRVHEVILHTRHTHDMHTCVCDHIRLCSPETLVLGSGCKVLETVSALSGHARCDHTSPQRWKLRQDVLSSRLPTLMRGPEWRVQTARCSASEGGWAGVYTRRGEYRIFRSLQGLVVPARARSSVVPGPTLASGHACAHSAPSARGAATTEAGAREQGRCCPGPPLAGRRLLLSVLTGPSLWVPVSSSHKEPGQTGSEPTPRTSFYLGHPFEAPPTGSH